MTSSGDLITVSSHSCLLWDPCLVLLPPTCNKFIKFPNLRPSLPLKDVFYCRNKDVVVIYHFFAYMYEWVFLLIHVYMLILTKDVCDYTSSCGNWCDLVCVSVYITMCLEFPFRKTYSHNKWLKSSKGDMVIGQQAAYMVSYWPMIVYLKSEASKHWGVF